MSPESTHPDHTGGGFVPRLGADPSSARYELLTAAQAVERVAAVGFDHADAELMVDQYLAQNTAAVGAPSGDGWRIDPYDLAEIARAYDWVDHYRGETIADARARAAQYAADYQRSAARIDREQDPTRAEQLDRETVVWGDGAREGHNPWSVPDPCLATADGVIGELTDAEERAAVEAVSNPLLDEADPSSNSSSDDGDGQEGDERGGGARHPNDTGPPPLLPTGAAVGAAGDEDQPATSDRPADAPVTGGRDDRAGGPGEARGANRAHDGAGMGDTPAAVAWWAPVDPEYTLTRDDVVAELTHRGMTTDQAAAAVTRYLDDTSREVGVPVHRWGMDSHDIEAITHTHAAGGPVEVPEQRGPVARGEWDQVRGDDPRSYDQMMGDAAALTGRPSVSTGAEDDRRDQLIRWHTDDHTDHARADGDGRDDAPVRALDDLAPTGATSEGW